MAEKSVSQRDKKNIKKTSTETQDPPVPNRAFTQLKVDNKSKSDNTKA